jgi:hypothetical protein
MCQQENSLRIQANKGHCVLPASEKKKHGINQFAAVLVIRAIVVRADIKQMLEWIGLRYHVVKNYSTLSFTNQS